MPSKRTEEILSRDPEHPLDRHGEALPVNRREKNPVLMKIGTTTRATNEEVKARFEMMAREGRDSDD